MNFLVCARLTFAEFILVSLFSLNSRFDSIICSAEKAIIIWYR